MTEDDVKGLLDQGLDIPLDKLSQVGCSPIFKDVII